ncbi:MAG: HEPN family nuclease [Bryobacteraceae bacterium]
MFDCVDKPHTRNEAYEFARRTRVNIEFLHEAKTRGEHVHIVTHLTNSLLGLIVIPKERYVFDRSKQITLVDLHAQGWPEWNITLDTGNERTTTLYGLIYHLRNAVAHGPNLV